MGRERNQDKVEIRWYNINGIETKYFYKACKRCGRNFHTQIYQQKYCTDRCKRAVSGERERERVKRAMLNDFMRENGAYVPEEKHEVKPVHISASAVVWR